MIDRAWLSKLAAAGLCCIATFAAGCGSNPKPKTAATTPATAPAPAGPISQPAPAKDPVTTLIETSQRHFNAGERELRLGHLDKARAEFDRAVDVLLESPYGARTEPRLREHFDRLVDRINAHEVTALAQGDGFVEKKYEPASIDELLKIATFPKPAADAATEKTVKDDLASTEHDVPIPQNDRVLAYVELFQGRLRDYIQESLTRGSRYLPMIQGVFKEAGLPLDLAYIPIIESGFKTNALSKASAKGPWQFMRATASEQGLKTDWYVDERSDPEKATVAAAKYLKLASQPVRRRLAPGPRGLQRRSRPRPARDEALGRKRLLVAVVIDTLPAARDARVRAAHPGRHHRRQEPGAVRLRHHRRKLRSATRRSPSRARSTCAASPSGRATASTRSRRSTRSSAAGRRR